MVEKVYRVPKLHEELFGNDKPRSLYFIFMTIFDFWEMHPLRPEFTSLYRHITDDQRAMFKEKYVTEVPIEGLTGVAPETHFEVGVHRSWQLIKYLERDGEIYNPLTILRGLEGGTGYVYEGHHRTGAAKLLGWDSVPGFCLDFVGVEEGYCNMPWYDREDMAKKQEGKGLPNSSRIHGMKIHGWSETELRTFMCPRPDNNTKYHMQGHTLSECIGMDHPAWKPIPKGITIGIKQGAFELPWEILS